MVVRLDGERVSGRYALFRTRGKDWMIHRMDPPEPGEPLPERLEPMRRRPAACPRNDDDWAFEIRWSGERVIAYCDTGHVAPRGPGGEDLRPRFPELGAIALELGGEPVVARRRDRRPRRGRRGRARAARAPARRRLGLADPPPRAITPATLIVFDLLTRIARACSSSPTSERRERLEALGLDGSNWQTPAYHRGDGKALLARGRRARASPAWSPSGSRGPTGRASAAATGARCTSR